MLVDTAHMLILGSFFELKVLIIHEKIRYVFYLVLIKVDYKDITLSRLCYYLSVSTGGTNTKTMFCSPYIYIYILYIYLFMQYIHMHVYICIYVLLTFVC